MDLGQMINKARVEKGYNKKDFAAATDINYKSFCSKLESNTVNWDELFRVAIVLDLDLNKLKEEYKKENLISDSIGVRNMKWKAQENKFRKIYDGRF